MGVRAKGRKEQRVTRPCLDKQKIMVEKKRRGSKLNKMLQKKLGCSVNGGFENESPESSDEDFVEEPKPEPVRHPPPAWLLENRKPEPEKPKIELNSLQIPEVSFHNGIPDNPLGMENGQIKNDQISSSGDLSQDGTSYHSFDARLNSEKYWISDKPPSSKVFLEVDFQKMTRLQHIAVQGHCPDRWVTAFYLQYSTDGHKWKLYKSTLEKGYMTTFKGNTDGTGIALTHLEPALKTNRIRIVPVRSNQSKPPAVRCEFYGFHE